LEQDFNSLHAQREACEAFIKSQAGEGWRLVKTAYDDGGLSGGTMERAALQRLLADINQGLIDVVVVYKVDRLTRSLADFAIFVGFRSSSRIGERNSNRLSAVGDSALRRPVLPKSAIRHTHLATRPRRPWLAQDARKDCRVIGALRCFDAHRLYRFHTGVRTGVQRLARRARRSRTLSRE
jgi:hypothetical protein